MATISLDCCPNPAAALYAKQRTQNTKQCRGHDSVTVSSLESPVSRRTGDRKRKTGFCALAAWGTVESLFSVSSFPFRNGRRKTGNRRQTSLGPSSILGRGPSSYHLSVSSSESPVPNSGCKIRTRFSNNLLRIPPASRLQMKSGDNSRPS